MLSLATLRSRWHAFLGTFAALAAGVALLGATGLVLLATEPRVPARLARADLLVQAPANPAVAGAWQLRRPWSQAEAAELAGRLGALDGVSAAVPDVAFYAQALVGGAAAGDAEDEPQGHGWSSAGLASFGLTAGRAPAAAGEVVLDETIGAAPGDRVTLLTAAGPRPYTVSGTVDGPGEYPAGYYVTDAEAARLGAGVTQIGVRADAQAADRVRALLGDTAEVLVGDAMTAAEPVREIRLRELAGLALGMITGLGTFTSIFVVASTFAFGTHQRRREFALLRLVGAVPRQVRHTVYAEAVMVSLAAGAAGSVLAAASAQWFADVLAGAKIVRPDLDVTLTWWPLAAAAAAGTAVAVLGVGSACRRAAKVAPLEALRTAAVETRPMTRARWAGGLLSALLAAVMAATLTGAGAESAVRNATVGAAAAVLSMALLGPALLPPLLRVACRPLTRLPGAAGLIVRESSLTGVRRIASATAPVMLTVSFAVLLVGSLTTSQEATANEEATRVGAGVAVTAVPHGAGLSREVAAAVPGDAVYAVQSTVYYRDEKGHWSQRSISGVSPKALAAVTRGHLKLVAGDLTRLTGGAFATRPDLAEANGWRLGDAVTVRAANGADWRMRLVALVDGDNLPGGGEALVAEDAVYAHDPTALIPVVFTDAPRAEVTAALAAPGATVRDMVTWARDDGGFSTLIWTFVMILVTISAGFGALSIANTLLMAVRDRHPEFRLLRLAGATPRQVAGVIATESTLIVALGTALGGVVSGGALLVMRSALADMIGHPVPLTLPWGVITGIVATCLAIALAASVIPAYRASRHSLATS
ncbi:ABC transporter permease [Pseudosporangium ferrugineum]|uniref:Putative ABC transport system permease protein n=1 Tax=Pseudosporangium ferrugineum TaxID=439699 RepID=A0A2T0RHD3_9ACTN|nr:FtsX-like permease family protein [Pseudosporangium ferrugineum]PRY20578.1 putative ABC transport system permease protein [Pseudosporangium ferrugineum]